MQFACKTFTKQDNTPLVELLLPTASNMLLYTNGLGTTIPYGEVYKTKGNAPAMITFTEKMLFGGKAVKPGVYYLNIVPNEKSWTVLLTPQSKVALGVKDFDATETATISTHASVNVRRETGSGFDMNVVSEIEPSSLTLSLELGNAYIEVPMHSAAKVGIKFPWKRIPFPSARQELGKELYLKPGKPYTLGDIDSLLSAAINRVGYSDKSYYFKENDFTFITQLEQIKDSGESQEDPYRWCMDVPPIREFTLSAVIKALFTAKVGRYRLIMFIITDDQLVYDKDVPEIGDLLELTHGSNVLPVNMKEQVFTNKHYINVLIYEFRKMNAVNEATFVKPSELSAETHLIKSRIVSSLSKK